MKPSDVGQQKRIGRTKHRLQTLLLSLFLMLMIALPTSACQKGDNTQQDKADIAEQQTTYQNTGLEALPAAEPVKSASSLDYSNKSNWAYYAEGDNKSADLFIVGPTVTVGTFGCCTMSMADKKTKQIFVGALNMERGIYEESCCLYAPYYRQASMFVYLLPKENAESYFSFAYEDVRAAFLQYMKEAPNDRPLVLAGFSQGSDMVLRLLKEFFNDARYQDRLVAAYCIGWRVTENDLIQYPWLKMAQTEDDLGVIVSFNSEAVNVKDSLLVPAGVKAYAINPLNWKTDSTLAEASENKGACFTSYKGVIQKEVPGLTGAYIDETRGTLKLPDIDAERYSSRLFPTGVYHLYDFQFFYRNLQDNVSLRVSRYCEQQVSGSERRVQNSKSSTQ